MLKLKRINGLLRDIGKYLSGISIMIMMIMIVLDVFMRNVFSAPLTGTYEIVQFVLMPIAVFPALGFVYWSGILPRLTELIGKTPKPFQKANKFLINSIDFVVFGLLTYFGFLFALSGLEDKMAVPVGGKLITVWPVYFLVPIGFLFVLFEIITRFRGDLSEKGELE